MTPFCFGLPSVVSATSNTCAKCVKVVGCLSQAAATLDKLPDAPEIARARLGLGVARAAFLSAPGASGEGCAPVTVVASARGVKRVTLSDAEEAAIAKLPAKVQSQVRTLMRRGWYEYARAEIAAGRNPSLKGWKQVLADKLIAGKATRTEVRQAFEQRLGMTSGSAKVQASTGIAIFAAGGLLTEENGQLSRPSDVPRAL